MMLAGVARAALAGPVRSAEFRSYMALTGQYELINSEMGNELFRQLEKEFDHIIIDVPPVGVVTDALLLAKYSKISLFVIRQGFTYKKQLEMIEELYRQKKLSQFALVVNDIERQKGYGYGYGYGTSYGYGYFEDDKEAKK